MIDQPELAERYEPAIRRLPNRPLTLADVRTPAFRRFEDQRIAVYYAPFDFVTKSARLALVGVTPGPTQMVEPLRSARDDLRSGRSLSSALERVKLQASFKGMRGDLARWLDELGLQGKLGQSSCSELFEAKGASLLHTTSAVRYPTFRRKRDGTWANYAGTGPGLLDHPELAAFVNDTLGPELQRVERAIIVPMGKSNQAIEHLCRNGVIDPRRCLIGLPHPSPASPFRERYFKQSKTALLAQVARLVGVDGGRPVRTKPAARRSMGETLAPPRRASRTPATTKEPEQAGPCIVIPLTQGNLNNNHVYLGPQLNFFPADAIGGRSKEDGLGRSLTIHFRGQADPVETDIAGGNKLFFRARSPWRAFFSRHRLKAGDSVTIVKLSDYQYRVEAGR